MEKEFHQNADVISSLESEIEKLHCGLMCEREHCKTLSVEHTTVKEQLQKARDQNKKFEGDLVRIMEDALAKVRLY